MSLVVYYIIIYSRLIVSFYYLQSVLQERCTASQQCRFPYDFSAAPMCSLIDLRTPSTGSHTTVKIQRTLARTDSAALAAKVNPNFPRGINAIKKKEKKKKEEEEDDEEEKKKKKTTTPQRTVRWFI